MTSVKALAIVALLAGGTSLAVAQGPPTGGYPPVSGGAGGNPAVPAAPGPPGPGVIPGGPAQSAATAPSRTRMAHHTTRHHNKMYMSAKSHKGSKLTPASNAKPQMKQ
jgi:hypothetical protein